MSAQITPQITSVFWGKLSAAIGDPVELHANLSGIEEDMTVKFVIYDKTPSTRIVDDTLPPVKVGKKDKVATIEWKVKYSADPTLTSGLPEYDFKAYFSGKKKSAKSTPDSLKIGELQKPEWRVIPGSKTPQNQDSRFTIFFTRTEKIRMFLQGLLLDPFVFDFFVFAAKDAKNASAERIDVIRDLKPQASQITFDWSLDRLPNYKDYFGRAFNFAYTFRLPDGSGGVFPDLDSLPANSNFYADQAKNVGEVQLTLASGGDPETPAGEDLTFVFNVKGGSPQFPLQLQAIPGIDAAVTKIEPAQIENDAEQVTVTLSTNEDVTADMSGNMLVQVIDSSISTALAVVAELNVPIAYKAVFVKLEYDDATKKMEVDDAISNGRSSTIHVKVNKRPARAKICVEYYLEEPDSGTLQLQTGATEDPVGDTTNYSLFPGTGYKRGKNFHLKVVAKYRGQMGKERDARDIRFMAAGNVSISYDGNAPKDLTAGMTYTIDFHFDRIGPVISATPFFIATLIDGNKRTPLSQIDYARYFSFNFDPMTVPFDQTVDMERKDFRFYITPTSEKVRIEFEFNATGLPPGATIDPPVIIPFDLNQ